MRKYEEKCSFLKLNRNMQLITKRRKISCSVNMRLKPEQRLLLGKLGRTSTPKKVLIESFSVSRTTVWFWSKQNLHYVSDLPRANHKFKITVETEITILYLRTTFKWGTARIQQGLFCLPEFMKAEMEVCVQGVSLSREAINQLLKKHRINGYHKSCKFWKFFRAEYPNELWQVDLKKFQFQSKKYELLVCIDDHSRFILLLKLFDKSPTIKEIGEAIKPLIDKYKPKKILTDNNPFKDEWSNFCRDNESEAIFAHPYYPQDKGKVERTIRNIAEEFVDLLSKFPKWINNFEEWRNWFNKNRFHRGVKDYPANLYVLS